jgi:hypothetical protein
MVNIRTKHFLRAFAFYGSRLMLVKIMAAVNFLVVNLPHTKKPFTNYQALFSLALRKHG